VKQEGEGEGVGKMDADNRVVLNCGGIRHEVYKVQYNIL
jgi:hypothetical protein